MKLINLTPHAIVLYSSDGLDILEYIPPSGLVAHVVTEPAVLEDWGLPVPVRRPRTHCGVTGLPDPQDGVIYVTSRFVADTVRRPDVLSPGTDRVDWPVYQGGRILGVTRLISWV